MYSDNGLEGAEEYIPSPDDDWEHYPELDPRLTDEEGYGKITPLYDVTIGPAEVVDLEEFIRRDPREPFVGTCEEE